MHFGARITLHLDALMKIMGEGSAHSEYRVLVMGPGVGECSVHSGVRPTSARKAIVIMGWL